MCRSYEMLLLCVKCVPVSSFRVFLTSTLKPTPPQGEGQTLEANSCTRSAKINVLANRQSGKSYNQFPNQHCFFSMLLSTPQSSVKTLPSTSCFKIIIVRTAMSISWPEKVERGVQVSNYVELEQQTKDIITSGG